jgi:hypothetical protein
MLSRASVQPRGIELHWHDSLLVTVILRQISESLSTAFPFFFGCSLGLFRAAVTVQPDHWQYFVVAPCRSLSSCSLFSLEYPLSTCRVTHEFNTLRRLYVYTIVM